VLLAAALGRLFLFLLLSKGRFVLFVPNKKKNKEYLTVFRIYNVVGYKTEPNTITFS
jgi:hypothetical protein